MTRSFLKTEWLNSANGAGEIGFEPITGLSATRLQGALEELETQVSERVFGVRLNGGSPETYENYLNLISPQVELVDNASLDSMDVIIHEETYVGPTAPPTPHRYKLHVNTSTSPPQLYRWTGSVWQRMKQALVFRETWAPGVQYYTDDLVTRNGSGYVVKTDHVSSGGAPPESNTTDYGILVSVGAAGTATLTGHGSTHLDNGSDPIADAGTTTNRSGLMSYSDWTLLHTLTKNHSALDNLTTGDAHTQYAKADGKRLIIATAPDNDVLNQVRMNSDQLERFDGSGYVPVRATPIDGSVTNAKIATAAGIAKSKLAALNIDLGDVASDVSLPIICTSLTRPSTAREGQLIVQTDNDSTYQNRSTNVNAPDWIEVGPPPIANLPLWLRQTGANTVYAAQNDGDPRSATEDNFMDSIQVATNGTASLKGTAARARSFFVPSSIVVSKAIVRVLSATGTIAWKIVIARASDRVIMGQTVAFQPSVLGLGWHEIDLVCTLQPGVKYLYCISNNNTTSNNYGHFHGPAAPLDATQFGGGGVGPYAYQALGVSEYFSVTLGNTTNTWSDPIPALAAAVYAGTNMGSLPEMYLRGSSS